MDPKRARRINKELTDCTTSPPKGMKISLHEDNLQIWSIELDGPSSTVYSGGLYKLKLTLPADYPFKAPQLNFQTRIYHPNITNDDQGNICLSILKAENWKPASQLKGVLEAVRQLLVEPQPDDALEARIADEYKHNRAEFEKTAKMYVERYAKP